MTQSNKLPPLIIPTIGSILGSAWAFLGIPYPEQVVLVLWLATVLLALVTHQQHIDTPKKTLSFLVTFLSVGLISQATTNQFNALHTPQKEAANAVLCGTVENITPEYKRQKITLKNSNLRINGQKTEMTWFTRAYVFCASTEPVSLGDIVELHNIRLKKPSGELSLYLKKEHALGFFFAKKKALIVHKQPAHSQSWLDKQKELLSSLIGSRFSNKTAQVIQSVFLGQTTQLRSTTRMLFEQWGISHYLARSGLHLVVLAFLISFLLGIAHAPLTIARLTTLISIGIYHLLTTPTVSFLRALMMNFAFAAAFLTGSTPSALHLFLLITLITVLTNPFVVFFADFQLSFGISGALIFVFNKTNQLSQQKR